MGLSFDFFLGAKLPDFVSKKGRIKHCVDDTITIELNNSVTYNVSCTDL